MLLNRSNLDLITGKKLCDTISDILTRRANHIVRRILLRVIR